MDANYYLKQALDEVKKIKPEDGEFLVKDLFRGYEWNRIEKRDRLRLGVLFINKVQSGEVKGIKIAKKTTSNQQLYEKEDCNDNFGN